MIIGSCFSGQGKHHIERGIVCQDASAFGFIGGSWYIGLTADGVGSCSKSDIGSKTAVETAKEVCIKGFPSDGDEAAILALMRTAFNTAMRSIEDIAEKNGDPLSLYDTTLDLFIWNGSRKLYYGHSGDGGIFVLETDGRYSEITSVQEGRDASSVVPLREGNHAWVFGVYEGDIAVAAAFTDGIRDKLVPPLYPIDVPLANRFMFVDVCGMDEGTAREELKDHMMKAVEYLTAPSCPITDDVSMAIMVSTDAIIEEPINEVPDYGETEYRKIENLYPDHRTMDQVFRRHYLDKMIREELRKRNREGDMDEEAILAALDKYYPLNEEERARYEAKYPAAKKKEDPEPPENAEVTPEATSGAAETTPEKTEQPAGEPVQEALPAGNDEPDIMSVGNALLEVIANTDGDEALNEAAFESIKDMLNGLTLAMPEDTEYAALKQVVFETFGSTAVVQGETGEQGNGEDGQSGDGEE